MNLALYILLFLHLHPLTLTSSAAAAAAAESPMMFPSVACSDQLVIFSSCLPFVCGYPNNRTDFPPSQCCDDVAAAFTNGSAICFCYLILEPDIFGFPLNSTKLLALTSICPRKDQAPDANFSLQKLCSESATLPPFRTITGSNNPNLNNTVSVSPPPQDSSSGPSTEQPAADSPDQASSSTQKIHWLRCTLIGSILLLRFSISYQHYADNLV